MGEPYNCLLGSCRVEKIIVVCDFQSSRERGFGGNQHIIYITCSHLDSPAWMTCRNVLQQDPHYTRNV